MAFDFTTLCSLVGELVFDPTQAVPDHLAPHDIRIFTVTVKSGRQELHGVSFTHDGRHYRIIDQNPRTSSVFAEAVTSLSYRIAWVFDAQGYEGHVVWQRPGHIITIVDTPDKLREELLRVTGSTAIMGVESR